MWLSENADTLIAKIGVDVAKNEPLKMSENVLQRTPVVIVPRRFFSKEDLERTRAEARSSQGDWTFHRA